MLQPPHYYVLKVLLKPRLTYMSYQLIVNKKVQR